MFSATHLLCKISGAPSMENDPSKTGPKNKQDLQPDIPNFIFRVSPLKLPQTTMTKKTFLSWVECRYARQFLQIGLDDQNSDIIALAGKNRQQT